MRGRPCIVLWLGLALVSMLIGCARLPGRNGDLRAPNGISPDQRAAASFLGVEPTALTQSASTVSSEYPGAHSAWTLSRFDRDAAEQMAATVLVNTDMYYVASMRWAEDRAHWGRSIKPGNRLLTREAALYRAALRLGWVCWFFDPADELVSTDYSPALPHPYFVFRWRGDGPEEYSHEVEAWVSAATGQIVAYSARVTPPTSEPALVADAAEALAPEQVEAKVREALPPDIDQPSIEVAGMTTECRVAPAGRRVYPVRVSGSVASPELSRGTWSWAQTWAVDAQTGCIYGLHVCSAAGERATPIWPQRQMVASAR